MTTENKIEKINEVLEAGQEFIETAIKNGESNYTHRLLEIMAKAIYDATNDEANVLKPWED